jgi:hypothetical protein
MGPYSLWPEACSLFSIKLHMQRLQPAQDKTRSVSEVILSRCKADIFQTAEQRFKSNPAF